MNEPSENDTSFEEEEELLNWEGSSYDSLNEVTRLHVERLKAGLTIATPPRMSTTDLSTLSTAEESENVRSGLDLITYPEITSYSEGEENPIDSPVRTSPPELPEALATLERHGLQRVDAEESALRRRSGHNVLSNESRLPSGTSVLSSKSTKQMSQANKAPEDVETSRASESINVKNTDDVLVSPTEPASTNQRAVSFEEDNSRMGDIDGRQTPKKTFGGWVKKRFTKKREKRGQSSQPTESGEQTRHVT